MEENTGNVTIGENPEESVTPMLTGETEQAAVLDLPEEEIESEESRKELAEDSPIKVYLKKVMDRVKKEMENGERPQCYKDGTFWIQPPLPIFRPIGNPIDYSLPHVFMWLPNMLLPRKKMLKCTSCEKPEKVR